MTGKQRAAPSAGKSPIPSIRLPAAAFTPAVPLPTNAAGRRLPPCNRSGAKSSSPATSFEGNGISAHYDLEYRKGGGSGIIVTRNNELLLKNVRPLEGEDVDLLVADGRIQKISKGLSSSSPETAVVQGDNAILIPGFVDAHSHLDKTLWGLPWHRNQAGPRLIDKIENERRLRREMNLSAEKQATHQIRQAIRMGTTHIRTHVDVDTEIGLKNLEGILTARETFRDVMTVQIVAFPQSGLLVRPGTVELPGGSRQSWSRSHRRHRPEHHRPGSGPPHRYDF